MLTSTQVLKRAGITYRQLDYWVRTEVLQCHGGVGSGTQRQFDESEAMVARVIGELLALGMSLQAVRRVVAQIRSLVHRQVRLGRFFVDVGGGMSREPSTGCCYVIDLDDVERSLADALA